MKLLIIAFLFLMYIGVIYFRKNTTTMEKFCLSATDRSPLSAGPMTPINENIIPDQIYPTLYENGSKNPNYRNGVFVIRPPYIMSNYYKPYKNISPTSIYKYNFLPYPMEG